MSPVFIVGISFKKGSRFDICSVVDKEILSIFWNIFPENGYCENYLENNLRE